jgi:hypothetical protein
VPAPGALAAPPIVLLTIEHAGRSWCISSRPCDVLDGSTWLHYRGGLAPCDVFQEAPFTGAADPQSQAVEVLADRDIAELAAQSHVPGEIRAELALYRQGDEWGQRLVMLSGTADVESGGRLGQPLRLSIRGDDAAELPGTWPPPAQVINSDTWPHAAGTIAFPERSHQLPEEGAIYPQTIGRAGRIWAGATFASVESVPILPVIMYDWTGGGPGWLGFYRYTPWGDVTTWAAYPGGAPGGVMAIVSAGWMYPGSGASKGCIEVTLDDGTPTPSWTRAFLYYGTDAIGNVLTFAKIDSGTPPYWGNLWSGRSYYAAIKSPCSGIANRSLMGGLEGAGEVVRWALERSRVTVDWRRTAAALPGLDRFRVAGVWDQGCSPWAWVGDNLLPLLPCSWIPGPNGIYPVAFRLDAGARDADAVLIDGIDCTIEGEPTIEAVGDVRSRWTLDYGMSSAIATARRRTIWHGGASRETPRDSMNLHLRRAQQRWGSLRGSALLALEDQQTAEMVYRDDTADRVCGWRSRLYSEPWTRLRVVSDGLYHRGVVAMLEPGMVVSLTSSRYSLSSRVAHVRRAGWLGGTCYADLVIVGRP